MKVLVYNASMEQEKRVRSCFRISEEVIQPVEVDFLNIEYRFWIALQRKRYDLVLVYRTSGSQVSLGVELARIKRLHREMIRKGSKCVWQFGSRMVALEEQEIYYILSCRKKVSVYTAKGGYRISTNMKQEEKRLPQNQFVRIHRNCIVNLEHVKQMEGSNLMMKNGKMLEISIRRKKQVKEELIRFGAKMKG